MSMSKPLGMTFHESYGTLPTHLLTTYRRVNASPADHDRLLSLCATNDGTDWNLLLELVTLHSDKGYLALPFYL